MSALDDITVVSFAQMAQGPLATQLLADMGAEVIKIEPPGGEVLRREESIDVDAAVDGDDAWLGLNTLLKNQNVTFLALNRNKKSIELDLKDESDRDVAYALVEDADVVVENFRPGVMARLGFGYETLSERNPALVYASASGYGSEGPYADKQGQDLLIQGISGLMSLTGDGDSPPTPVGLTVVDAYSAVMLAFAVVTALHHRHRTGEGQRIEGDLLSSAVHLLTQEIAVYGNTGEPPERGSTPETAHAYLQAPYGVYETTDGHLTLSLSPISTVGEALGDEELAQVDSLREAYSSRDELNSRIASTIRTESTDYWLEEFAEYDIWCGPVQSLAEAMEHPQVDANDMIRTVEHPDGGDVTVTGIPVRLSETPGTIRTSPPLLDQHADELLDRVSDADGR